MIGSSGSLSVSWIGPFYHRNNLLLRPCQEIDLYPSTILSDTIERLTDTSSAFLFHEKVLDDLSKYPGL